VTSPGPFRHEALFYGDGAHGFLAGAISPVDAALENEASVLVAVRRANASALREALSERAKHVRFVDMEAVGRNPARIISVWREHLERHTGGDTLGVGEPVWPERSVAELDECIRHEALLNLAFDGGWGWHLLCPYDIDALEDHVIEAAQRTHPVITRDGSSRRSRAYGDGEVRPFDGDLPSRPHGAEELAFGMEDLSRLRRLVAAWAEEQSLAVEGGEDLVLAVNELAINSVAYGGGRGALRMWREGGTLLCEVEDCGLMHPPLVGRIRPEPDAASGRGLWIANQLCDLVQIRSSPGGTVVRVHKALC
jgi:anti-sigma regulatory factor (Ser/Thr protein kinase)